MINSRLISVIVPTYNHERFIQTTLKSLINQTYRNLELIILNDGSNDATDKKISEMEDECRKRFSTFIYVNKNNEGLARTLNQGIGLARGEYIFFTASDDVVLPDAIERLAHEMDGSDKDTAVVCGDAEFIDEEGRKVFLGDGGNTDCVYKEGKNFDSVIKYCRHVMRHNSLVNDFGKYKTFIMSNHVPAGRLVKKAALLEVGLFEEGCSAEDYEIALKLAKRYKMRLINGILMQYRLHPANTIKRQGRNVAISVLNIFLREKKYCFEHGYARLWRRKMVSFLAHFIKRLDIINAIRCLKNI